MERDRIDFWQTLKDFIAIKTIAGDQHANSNAVDLIVSLLKNLGFDCKIEGESEYYQPCIIAQREPIFDGQGELVIYAHYDVEKVRPKEKWESEPFQLTKINSRYYGRGIADNKGIFLSRLKAVEELLIEKKPSPAILWLIQGEEEVGTRIAFEIFKKYIEQSKAWLYIDETAYHKNSVQEFLTLNVNNKLKSIIDFLGNRLSQKDKSFEIQERSLNKSLTPSACPLLTNIPKQGTYFAFGPNDTLSNIHRANESLDEEYLLHHIEQFKDFLEFFATQEFN